MMFSKIKFYNFYNIFFNFGIFFPNYLLIFKDSIPFLLGLVMFGMGMTLNFNQVKKVLLKPYLILIAVCLQFTVMPLAAYFLIKIFRYST